MKRELITYNKFDGGVNYDTLNKLGLNDDELLIADNIEPDLRGGFTLRRGTKNVNKYSYEGKITQLIDFNQKDGSVMEMAIIDKVLYDISQRGSVYQSSKRKICDVANDTIGYVVYKNRFYFVDGEDYRVLGDYQYTTQFGETPIKKGDVVLNFPISKGTMPGITNNFYKALTDIENSNLLNEDFGDVTKWVNVTHRYYPSIPDDIRNITSKVIEKEIVEIKDANLHLTNASKKDDWYTLSEGNVEPSYPINDVINDSKFGHFDIIQNKIHTYENYNSWLFEIFNSDNNDNYLMKRLYNDNEFYPGINMPIFVNNLQGSKNRSYLYMNRTYLQGWVAEYENYNKKEMEFFIVADIEKDGCIFSLLNHHRPENIDLPIVTVYKDGNNISVSARAKYYENITTKTIELNNINSTFILNLSINFYEGHFSLYINGEKTSINKVSMQSKGTLDIGIDQLNNPVSTMTYSLFAYSTSIMNTTNVIYKNPVVGKLFSFTFFDRELQISERESLNYYLYNRYVIKEGENKYYKDSGNIIIDTPIELDVSIIDTNKTYIRWDQEIPKETQVIAYFSSSNEEGFIPGENDWTRINNNALISFMSIKKYSFLKFELSTKNKLATPKIKNIRIDISNITEKLPINKCTMLEFHDTSLRIFASGNPEDRTCVFFSEINEPDNFKDTNKLYITREDGHINALTNIGDSLLVHCQHSIWKYSGIDENDWKWKRLPITYGAMNKEAVSVCTGSIVLYANKNIQVIDYNAITDSAVSYPGKLMYSLSDNRVNKELLNIVNDSKVRTVFNDNRLYISYSNEDEKNNSILVYDFSSNSFISKYTGINANCFLVKNNGDLYIGSENYILKLSNDFYSDIDKDGNQVPINLHLLTKKFTFNSPTHYKIFWFFKIIISMYDKYGSGLKVNLKIDYSNKSSFEVSLDSDSFMWDKWGKKWGFDDGASLEAFVREKGIRCQVEFRFNEDIGYNIPPYIYGFVFDVEYSDIPLKKIHKKKLLSENYE